MSAGACRACAGTWPSATEHVADLPHTTVYLHEDQFFPGWTVLVLKRHATELFHLDREERAGVIEEVAGVARALSVACALSIGADDFRAVMQRHPSIALAVLDDLAHRLEQSHQRVAHLSVGTVDQRVAAALLGSDERVEYTLVGDVVNLCQRLQQFAQPGETVLSEATWTTLTTTPARFEQLGEQLVKGRDTPVIAYRLPSAEQPEPQTMGAS